MSCTAWRLAAGRGFWSSTAGGSVSRGWGGGGGGAPAGGEGGVGAFHIGEDRFGSDATVVEAQAPHGNSAEDVVDGGFVAAPAVPGRSQPGMGNRVHHPDLL